MLGSTCAPKLLLLAFGNNTAEGLNNWVWFPNTKGNHLSHKIYSYFNCTLDPTLVWKGWKILWRLKVAPRVKNFIWLIFHDKVKTKEYLYHLTMGSNRLCILCDLENETSDHLFQHCIKVQSLWGIISNYYNMHITFYEGFSSANWITANDSEKYIQCKSIIASAA